MMKKTLGILLATTTLAGPALAQAAPAAQSGPAPAPSSTPAPAPEEEVEISAPGASNDEIVVVGTRIPNAIRASREVVSVLSQGDIARTGEGDIAGALQRVTGLSVVGGRFVYVRGLGERYSLALLNGLPIPSPDPLRRVVPLDLFPTSVLASSVVQKSYSANFPGEFGGGVINITTRAIPEKPFFTVSGSIGANTATTGQLGYVHAGGRHDWTGFDDGTRTVPAGVSAAQDAGRLLALGPNFNLRQLQDLTATLNNAETNVIQRNEDIPVNWSVGIQGGRAWDIGEDRLGLIFSLGFSNDWRTKAGLQQQSGGVVPGPNGQLILRPDRSFDFVATEFRSVLNALVGVGYEFGEHKLRWTNLYVNDTLKRSRIQRGVDNINVGDEILLQRDATFYARRQLIDTQLVSEFKWDNLSLDVRGTYANSKRLAPYERFNNYAFTTQNGINDFINDLRSPGQSSLVAFSRLNEDVYGAGADLSYKFEDGPFPIRLTAGYGFTQSRRISSRFEYRFQSQTALPLSVAQQRPDFLLSDFNVYTYGIFLNTISTQAPVYRAGLTVHAGYGQIEIEPADGVQFVAGVRYENGNQFVNPIDVFNVDPNDFQTRLKRNYWLPSATLTWNFAEDMQLRFAASQTIARPQFREQSPQFYFDPDSDRNSFGNQFLVDSKLLNLEARYEWYFGRDERIAVGGFYKNIDRPIDTVAFDQGGTFLNTFANAPKARLWGGEIEIQKYWALDSIGGFLDRHRLLTSVNYTYTNSQLVVRPGDTTIFPFTGEVRPATDLFRDGLPLTGQSDHVANLQLSLQALDTLSEQTLLLNYASDRVAFRGPTEQPDLKERPGLRLDFVWRQALSIAGFNFEAKFEGRNLTNVRYQEFQSLNGSRVDTNTYVLGRSFQLGVSTTF